MQYIFFKVLDISYNLTIGRLYVLVPRFSYGLLDRNSGNIFFIEAIEDLFAFFDSVY